MEILHHMSALWFIKSSASDVLTLESDLSQAPTQLLNLCHVSEFFSP